MSRCFPYPPPGYTLSRASKGALIESIKLQKKREKAKEQRKKEKRSEKKEKRKEKIVETNQKLDYYDTLKGSTGKSILANSEQLEKSSITEENEQPVCLPLPSSSSESTENSNKRKRQSSPADGNQGYCNIILLRMPSKKQNESDASIIEQQLCSTYERTQPSKIQKKYIASINELHTCSTSGRTDIPAQNKDDSLRNRQENFCCLSEEISYFGQGFTPETDRKLICSTSVKIDAISPGKTGSPSVPGAVTTAIQRQELLYKNLIENCFPPHQQDTSFHSDDLSWLFPCKNEDSLTMKRQKSGPMSCSMPTSLWQPRARYLPEVDEYALPYTVPF